MDGNQDVERGRVEGALHAREGGGGRRGGYKTQQRASGNLVGMDEQRQLGPRPHAAALFAIEFPMTASEVRKLFPFFDAHAVVHTCSVTRDPTPCEPSSLPPSTGDDEPMYVFISHFDILAHFICRTSNSSSKSGPPRPPHYPPLHFAHLDPFLSLLAGWLGMARLGPVRLVRDPST